MHSTPAPVVAAAAASSPAKQIIPTKHLIKPSHTNSSLTKQQKKVTAPVNIIAEQLPKSTVIESRRRSSFELRRISSSSGASSGDKAMAGMAKHAIEGIRSSKFLFISCIYRLF